MTATYSLSKAELNADFIESIKNTFKSDRISISIEEEIDETERILENKVLYEKIMNASEEAKEKMNMVRFEENEFIEKYGSI
jgi:hypothetical protein